MSPFLIRPRHDRRVAVHATFSSDILPPPLAPKYSVIADVSIFPYVLPSSTGHDKVSASGEDRSRRHAVCKPRSTAFPFV